MQSTLDNRFSIGKVLIQEKKLDSTNDYAMRLLEKGEPEQGTVVIASYQTQGKGNYGNTWESSENQNLTFSIIFYPDFLKADQQFMLNKAVSLGLHDILHRYLPRETKIKWPNDIYHKSGKLAGILIESLISGSRISGSVVGIGVNINQTAFQKLPNAVSLSQLTGKKHDLKVILFEICSAMELRYMQLQRGDVQSLDDDYQNALYHAEGFHDFETNDGKLRAKVKGVDESGKLLLKPESGGELRSFTNRQLRFLH